MKPLPTDPMARHARFVAALCDDFASPEFLRTGKTPRADALVATADAIRSSEFHRGTAEGLMGMFEEAAE